MTSIDRLTDELAYPVRTPAAGHDWVGVRADDLALVLAVVEAAQTYVDECAGLGDAARVIRTFDALAAALAAIEGAKP